MLLALVLIVLAWGLTAFIRNTQGNPHAVVTTGKETASASTFEYIYSTNLLQLKGID
nr:hypothetical protein [Mycoplasmopsis bovis]